MSEQIEQTSQASEEVVTQEQTPPPATEEVTPPVEGAAAEPQKEEVPAYTPNFKYKVYDEEKEIDEFLRTAVKTPENEKRLREIFEKADGLPKIKEKYESQKTEYAKIKEDFTKQSQIVGNVLGLLDKKDYRSFFKEMGVPEEDILRYALDVVQYQEMSPEQRKAVDDQRKMQEQALYFERQNQELTQTMQQQAVQTRTIQLEGELSKPDVNSFLSNFDSAFGKPGAFREEVIKQGQLAWFTQGVDLPVEQAVKRVMDMYGNVVSKPATPPQTPPVVQPKQVLPNVQSSGGSPAKVQVRTLDDIRKLAQTMD